MLDREGGCVRGRRESYRLPSLSPLETVISRKIQDVKDTWEEGQLQLQKRQSELRAEYAEKGLKYKVALLWEHAPTAEDLRKIYGTFLDNKVIAEHEPQSHPVFPGFSHLSIPAEKDIEHNIAYRCGACKIIYAGAPRIYENEEQLGFVSFGCRVCQRVMYSEDAEPNVRTC